MEANLLGSLMEAFRDALVGHELYEINELIERDDTTRLGEVADHVLNGIAATDANMLDALFRRYLANVIKIEESFGGISYDVDALSAAFSESIDKRANQVAIHSSPNSGLSTVAESLELAANAIGSIPKSSLLLVPVHYLTYKPFGPFGIWASLASKLRECLRPGRLSTFSDVAQQLFHKGIIVRFPMVGMCGLCDKDLVVVQSSGPMLCRIADVLPRFRMVSLNVSCGEYIEFRRHSNLVAAQGYCNRATPVAIDTCYVRKLWGERIAMGLDADMLDWCSIGAKMYQHCLCGDEKIQSLNVSLHREIVNALLHAKRAMKRSELEEMLGVGVPLSPETLPPGRIMAYAVNKAHLQRDHAYYVLRDWVASDNDARGKIPKFKIVTPFVEKNAVVTDAVLAEVLNGDPLYRRAGLFSITSVARQIAERLPERPTELYYVTLIEKQLKQSLSPWTVCLSLGFYVPRSRVGPMTREEMTDEQRVSFLKSVIHAIGDVPAFLEGILEADVRDKCRRLLQQSAIDVN